MAGAVSRWLLTPAPLGRVAVLRTVLYLFVVFDVLVLLNDVVPHGYAPPELYQPVLIPRVLGVPAPTPLIVHTLQVVLLGATLVAATGRLPRLAGWTIAVTYLLWIFYAYAYGKIDHDHLALVVALLVLPTVGRARYGDATPSAAAGWALRCVQIAVIATYFLSAYAKLRWGGLGWANSAIFYWALTRRGTWLGRLVLERFPWTLRPAQWGLLAVEFASFGLLFARGRLLAIGAGFFLLFHLMTYLTIGIHFLPTVVCWLAFAPLERLPGGAARDAEPVGPLGRVPRSSQPAGR